MILLTFLVCTRNGSATLADCLAHIGRQTDLSHDEFEVVVVDNGSTDGTKGVAQSALAELKCETKLLIEPKEGKLNAFLRGVRESNAPYVAVIDDDNLVCENYAYYTVSMFSEFEKLGMIGSANTIDARNIPSWFPIAASRFGCAVPTLQGDIEKIDEYRAIASHGIIAGAGSAFRKDIVLRALELGFSFSNDTLRGRKMTVTGEDTELCFLFQYCGYWFGFDRRIALRHRISQGRLNWSYARRLARSIGAGGPVYDAFIWLDSTAAPWRSGTWWWLAARRFRRLARMLPKVLSSPNNPSGILLYWEAELGGLIRLCRERGEFTRKMREMKSSRWARELRNSRVRSGC